MPSSRKVRVSPVTVASNHDPLNYFAGEINGEIFSHLSARDVAECMLVNKDWRNRVAHLSVQPWKTLNLVYDVTRTISEQPPPFSENIEIVNFLDYDTGIVDALESIVSWNCRNIKRLSFYECEITDQVLFIEALEKIASQLRVLVFEEHQSDIDLLSILDACPQLQSLHFQPEIIGDYQRMELGVDKQEHEASRRHTIFENLTCLSIDSVVGIPAIRNILKRCPNLRCVRLGNTDIESLEDPDIQEINMNNETTDLEMIIEHCPGIEYIECNRMDNSGKDGNAIPVSFPNISWWQDYMEHDKALPSRGLRVLKFFGVSVGYDDEYDFGQVFRLIKQSQNTLEVLYLAQCENLEGLHTLHMPKLRELACKNDIYSEKPDQLNEFIEHCPSLEKLEIDATAIGLLSPDLAGILARLNSLKTLSFQMPYKNYFYNMDVLDGPMVNACTLLQSMGAIDTHVEHMSFGTQCNGFPLFEAILHATATIRSLRSLQLHNYELLPEDTDDYVSRLCSDDSDSDLFVSTISKTGLSSFIKAIQNSNIERIWFSKVSLSNRAFQHLGDMRSLQELRITNCNPITKAGLRLLLDRKPFNGAFKSLVVDGSQQRWTNKKECFKLLSRRPYGFIKHTKEKDHLHMEFVR
ncbi:hypothetical protein BJV82DRAFT_585293 [Fennellomyces sp. T-0311]|nr:hypothetical protein BJV82DRAFT_585293 [Fennellomyces sp. T-0311]